MLHFKNRMRKSIISIIIAVICVSTAFAQSGEIIVDLSGIKKIKG
jgi:hypothetical protein